MQNNYIYLVVMCNNIFALDKQTNFGMLRNYQIYTHHREFILCILTSQIDL